MKHVLMLLSVFSLLFSNAHAESPAPEMPASPVPVTGFSVQDAYSYATPPGQTAGVVFFTIVNNTSEADKVTGVETEIAASAMLHTNMIEQDTVTMIKVDNYDVPANGTLKLESNGHHVMLIGLKEPLVEGGMFGIKITFAKAPPLTADVTVRAPGEQSAAVPGHAGHENHAAPETAGTDSSSGLDTSSAPAHHEEPSLP
jgi:periplasmic copper chaperone A